MTNRPCDWLRKLEQAGSACDHVRLHVHLADEYV